MTNPTAARIDEVQFDLGEGPCWNAVATGRPVLLPYLRSCSGDEFGRAHRDLDLDLPDTSPWTT